MPISYTICLLKSNLVRRISTRISVQRANEYINCSDIFTFINFPQAFMMLTIVFHWLFILPAYFNKHIFYRCLNKEYYKQHNAQARVTCLYKINKKLHEKIICIWNIEMFLCAKIMPRCLSQKIQFNLLKESYKARYHQVKWEKKINKGTAVCQMFPTSMLSQ
jgi:hypothetical protein